MACEGRCVPDPHEYVAAIVATAATVATVTMVATFARSLCCAVAEGVVPLPADFVNLRTLTPYGRRLF